MQKLFDLAIHPKLPRTERLYFRRREGDICYNTFFNMIPLRKLRAYTRVRKILFDREVGIHSEKGLLKTGTEIALDEIEDGTRELFLTTAGQEPRAVSVCAEGESRAVSLCIIICTYHRAESVLANVRGLLEILSDIHIILVDNASEIPLGVLSDARLTVLHNENSGGSGGFGRGMREAVAMNRFTHLVLMDDDVVIDPVAIQKIAGFYRFLKPEFSRLCIAGAMLHLYEPTFQFESGGFFSDEGVQKGYGYHFDLTDPAKLLENEAEKRVNYGGWWLFAMPCAYPESGAYPAPFFLKFDDVEYALRCKMPILTLNGVGVWHEAFGCKYNSVQEYFNVRNYLFLMCRHTPDFSPRKAYLAARRFLIEKLCRQQYRMAQAVLIAYSDYLKGEAYLREIDYSQKLRQLSALNYTLLDDAGLRARYGVSRGSRAVSRRPFRRYMQPLLYGHLLPDFLCVPLIVTDNLTDRKEHYFGAVRALHYDDVNHCGYVTRKSLRQFLRGFWQLSKIYHNDLSERAGKASRTD